MLNQLPQPQTARRFCESLALAVTKETVRGERLSFSPMHPNLGDYRFIDAIARGWGLAIRCTSCGRELRWNDSELEAKFADLLEVEVEAVVRCLRCSCGAKAATAYFYNAGSRDTGQWASQDVVLREAELRVALERRQNRPAL